MATPTHLSPTPNTSVESVEMGARMLGLHKFPGAGTGVFEQGYNVARVMESCDSDGLPTYPTVGVLLPRRSTKTTSVWAVLLGRMALTPDYKVVTTAQDGTRARRRFREVARMLEANGFEDAGNTIRWANGDEALEMANGSRLWVVTPSSGAFRGEAADAMLFDEAGELDPSKSDDLLEGALPLLDTRPMGQAIIAGTPAKQRAGLLWSTLQDGREGAPGTGVVDYSIRDDEECWTEVEVGTEGAIGYQKRAFLLNEDVVRRVHPGIGTLTTWAKMQARFKKMGPVSFDREYMCRFPFDNTTTAFDMEAWGKAEAPAEILPATFGLAYDVAPDGSSAAICAAWRDQSGLAYVTILEHRQGVSWLPRTAHAIARKYRVPIRYDSIGANHGPGTEIQRLRGVTLVPSTGRDAMGAAQGIVSALSDGSLRHFGQASLTEAADGAAWRQGDGGRYFARTASVNDISPMVAASLALWQADQTPSRKPMRIRSSNA